MPGRNTPPRPIPQSVARENWRVLDRVAEPSLHRRKSTGPKSRTLHLTLCVLPFLVPGHLDRFELRLVRNLRVVVETVEGEHSLAEIGEAKRQRIDTRELLRQRDGDVFRVCPLHGVTSCVLRSFLSDFPSWMPPPSCT